MVKIRKWLNVKDMRLIDEDRYFYTLDECNEYIENHERPDDLIIVFEDNEQL